jgi:serine/threonine protein kinase
MPNTERATRYREIRRLGAGGMATVTLAEDTLLGRPVALKRVYGMGDPREMLRLKREAMVGASLNHPNLVFVYDAQLQEDGDVVIVMEYVDGENLAHAIRSRGALPPGESLRVLRGVAAALDAIHQRGIVHRDVKPANVLLGRNGAVKLADLGVADVADRTRITTSGAVVGSFSYMAPEQLDGVSPNPAMDVYALAAVAYEMLGGEKARPESNPLALAHAIATRPPPNLRDVWPAAPAAAAAVLQRGMAADPADRPRSAGELVRRLETTFEPERRTQNAPAAARAASPIPPVDPRSPAPAGRTPRRSSIVAPALLALAALAVCGVVVAALTSAGGKKSSGTATRSTHAQSPAHGGTTRRPTAGTSSRSATTPQSATTSHSATTGTSAAGSASSTSSPERSAPATPAPPAAASGSASGAPAAAVQQFYQAAARHDYGAAWALAGPNLRSELGGYPSFRNTFSSVRSITFRSARVLPGSSSSRATVAISTTSVQTNRTQQCSGTATTVRNGGAWLLDGISINCS